MGKKRKKKNKRHHQPASSPPPPVRGSLVERRSQRPAPAFAEGDLVRVRKGVADPDFPDLPLGGWTGTVLEVDVEEDPELYLVEWNEYTLEHQPEAYRVRCDREGLDFDQIRLAGADLEPATGEQAPLEQPANLVALPLRMDDQEDRIRAILGVTSDQVVPEVEVSSLDKYYTYLLDKLSFPLNVRFWTSDPRSGRSLSVLATAYRLLPPDGEEEMFGLMVDAGIDEPGMPKERVPLPLADLELLNDKPDLLREIQDYSYWYAEFGGEDWEPDGGDLADLGPVKESGPPSPWAFWSSLGRVAVYGAGAGAVLGSILLTLPGAQWALLIGAFILGLAGFLFGARSATVLGRQMRALHFSSVTGGLTCAFLGGLLGGIVGLLLVACVGTILGSIAGSLLGRGLRLLGWRPLTEFWWIVLGTLAGGLVLAFVYNRDLALDGAFYGMGVGAVLAVVLLLASVVVLVSLVTPRPR